MTLNIMFAGTPHFAKVSLSAILESSHKVVAVLTQPDRPKGRGQMLEPSPVKILALEHNIPVLQPTTLKTKENQDQIASFKPDLMIVVAYGMILPEAVLSIPRLGCINVHASLLPRWRGAAPIQHAIMSGDSTTGITLIQMDKGLDTGDILSLHPSPIRSKDTSQTLHDRLAQLGAKALGDMLDRLELGYHVSEKQDETKATYAPKIIKTQGKIDWTENAKQIERKIRAFNPWPVAFFEVQGTVVRVFEAEALKAGTVNLPPTAKPGSIINRSSLGIDVATGEGIVRLLELQLPGRKRVAAQELLNSDSDLFILDSILL